jgi:hypothetical protein
MDATEKLYEWLWFSLYAQTEQQPHQSLGVGCIAIQDHDLIVFLLQNCGHDCNQGALAATTLSADQYSFTTKWFVVLPGMCHLIY